MISFNAACGKIIIAVYALSAPIAAIHRSIAGYFPAKAAFFSAQRAVRPSRYDPAVPQKKIGWLYFALFK